MSEPTPTLRTVRSFVRRQGRVTAAQERALDDLWPEFGIEGDTAPLDPDLFFGRTAPRVLEIGFGNGDSLAAMALAHPETDYLGIEVHRPGVGRLLHHVSVHGLTNVRVMCTDAVGVLEHQLPEGSFDAVFLFFPDPWHKTRHHKRRLVQFPFVEQVRRVLKTGGRFHMATDWRNYAEQMLRVVGVAPGFRNLSPTGDYTPRPEYRPLTKFEQRGHRLGHGVWDLMFERVD